MKKTILIMLLILFNFNQVEAYMIKEENCSYTLKHTLATKVQSGLAINYRLAYKNNSKYATTIDSVIVRWQEMQKVAIMKTAITNIIDVTISDYSQVDNIAGVTNFANKTIKFNSYYFDSRTTAQKEKTILHEFGHALGLDHHSVSNNVMVTGKTSRNTLGTLDKSSYNCYWK